jgi:mRNA interferase RelE/StbE
MIHNPFQHYTILFSKNAEKFLYSLDEPTRQRIIEKIKEFKTNYAQLDTKKLKSLYGLYRLRIGCYRVVYSIKNERIMIYIVAIGHRRNIYQQL